MAFEPNDSYLWIAVNTIFFIKHDIVMIIVYDIL